MKLQTTIKKIIESIIIETNINITKDFRKRDKALSPWVQGTIDNYFFTAAVYDEPSMYGIKDSRVSKLMISTNKNNYSKANLIAIYDRRWEVKPKTSEDKQLIDALIIYLNNL